MVKNIRLQMTATLHTQVFFLKLNILGLNGLIVNAVECP